MLSPWISGSELFKQSPSFHVAKSLSPPLVTAQGLEKRLGSHWKHCIGPCSSKAALLILKRFPRFWQEGASVLTGGKVRSLGQDIPEII